MAQSASTSPSEDFFNDLSRQPSDGAHRRRSSSPKNAAAEENDSNLPRTKRIACIVCRKRKLKCDGTRPRCSTCARLGHNCAYDEARKKSGPKRGYVKHLEARLAQVETLLNHKEPAESGEPSSAAKVVPPAPYMGFATAAGPNPSVDVTSQFLPDIGIDGAPMEGIMNDIHFTTDEPFTWEVISLGLDEPLPTQDVIDELHDIYFTKVHATMPVIHRPRYLNAMNLAPNMRPPVCLRYALWTHAAHVSPKYSALTPHFYARARKYAEQDELRGFGESMITVTHCQCWSVIASFEFKMMYFPRAWMSVGRAGRLALLMSLNSQDRAAIDVKQALPPPRDWTEREERRRTFWLAFCQDRYASVGTGWPMMFDERDVATNLPATESAFLNGREEKTLPLNAVMTPDGAATLSSFGGVVLMAYLFGRNLNHVHRPEVEDNDQDVNSAFWKRHRTLDNILLNTSLSLPDQLRLPAGIDDTNVIFVNMTIHSATICLHQAAIFRADKSRLSSQISVESKRRCMIAADQIANIMRLISHIDLATVNPFLAFCLYVSARVFVQYLKANKHDLAVTSSLQFLLAAMQALKAKNPLTESFLVQLDVDLDGSGLEMPSNIPGKQSVPLRASGVTRLNTDQADCMYILKMRGEQPGTEGCSIPPMEPPGSNVPSGGQYDFSGSTPSERERGLNNLPDRTIDSPRPPDFVFGTIPTQYGRGSNSMDMDAQGAQVFNSLPNSGQPTPSGSSNNASSHASYSPAGLEDHVSGSATSPGMAYGSNNPFPGRPAYSTFTPGSSGPPDPTLTMGTSNPFALHSSWKHFDDAHPAGHPQTNLDSGLAANEDNSWQTANPVQNNDWVFAEWTGSGNNQT